ncbi:MAG: DUF362 domain-containing protein [Candidatus Margulisbacteria bacterium]|nr:DUF362 domain-containing protein [Candidatus Margulisiibacteriota bacterium]MBU1021565.1 DUF362 domain-containing protein [Candidatus Margulisiibacteriota bacterium]MBU1728716.1 DUF362 domain-containing protein [Candidatus Margulisiibacteriota bacterium]MBU1955167.1 DUF362 domain-containing protein [Candidatus Margulisiibacteriota bacterium]
MKSKVYFINNITELDKLLNQIDLTRYIKSDDYVAGKIHFGEEGNKAYLKPQNIKPIFSAIEKVAPHTFLTDCNTIYKGSRSDSVNHLKTAKKHGYDFAPLIIADGLFGHNVIKVTVDLKHFKEVSLGACIVEADAIVCFTHFKGHDVTGFGGALKNMGMGNGSRAGKQLMHADIKPQVIAKSCTGCGICVKWCPTSAITMDKKIARIDLAKCIGCAECIAACRFAAIGISWAGTPNSVQEKIAEYAAGAIKDKKGKIIYFNFLLEISPNCDCYAHNDPPIVPDIGILFSDDPVAIDQASLDLVNQKAGKDIFKELYPNVDGTVQLQYAQKIGLGQRQYELITG